jgi:benzoyl-CoA reductase/2-hydroxyglutaryl-CoA dehydratase subunit BcrC/BadD/HgdB
MVTGTDVWPDNWKLAPLVEESSRRGIIVADEGAQANASLTTQSASTRWSMDDMLNAIGERYLMASTCPCFTSKDGNEDRINWLLNKVKDWKVKGYLLCGPRLHALRMDTRVKKHDKINVPVYYLDTEYTREDVGQMKTRVEAFLEMLTASGLLK